MFRSKNSITYRFIVTFVLICDYSHVLYEYRGLNMDRIRVAYSDGKSCIKSYKNVLEQLREGMAGTSPVAVLFTCDYNNFSYYSKALNADFPDSEVIGMSSYVVMSSIGHSLEGLSAIAIYSGIECASGVIHEISRYPLRYTDNIREALSSIGSTENCCCLAFTTAFCQCEELVLDAYKSVLTEVNVPIFGSSAGAPDDIRDSYVSLNGTILSEASVFIIIKNLNGRIGIFRENMFRPTKHYFTATDVDCDERAVYEYDDIPAAQAVAVALGISVNELNEQLKLHPMGRIEHDEIYITESNCVGDDLEITYYSRIYNRTKVVLLETDDIDKVFEATRNNIRKEFDSISFSLVINCLSRSKYFMENGRFDDFSDTLTAGYGSYIGFSGYGEQADYKHQNQTMLLAVFE